MSAARALDHVHSLAQLDALAPDAIAAAFGADVPAPTSVAELEHLAARLEATVTALDAMCTRAMKLRLERDLAMESSIAAPTRNVFSATVTSYAGRLSLLAERARDVSARSGSREPDDVAARVVDAAANVLALRDRVIAALLGVVAERVAASAPTVEAKARDRREPDAERKRASALRRELEATAAQPTRIADGTVAERLARWAEQLDEPDPSTEPSWADMIEID